MQNLRVLATCDFVAQRSDTVCSCETREKMITRGVQLLAIAGACNALVPHLRAAARSSPLGAFKSNFPPVDGPETDNPAAAKTESDAATDASRAALEASFAKAEAEPVAAAGLSVVDSGPSTGGKLDLNALRGLLRTVPAAMLLRAVPAAIR